MHRISSMHRVSNLMLSPENFFGEDPEPGPLTLVLVP